jgi:hypothetical protein
VTEAEEVYGGTRETLYTAAGTRELARECPLTGLSRLRFIRVGLGHQCEEPSLPGETVSFADVEQLLEKMRLKGLELLAQETPECKTYNDGFRQGRLAGIH